MEKFKEIRRNVGKAVLLIYRSDKRLSVLHLLLLLFVSLLPLALLYATKYLVDAVERLIRYSSDGIPKEIWLFAGLFCLIYLFSRLFSIFDNYVSGLLGEKTINNIQRKIQQQSAALDMSYYDTPSYYDAMYMAQQEAASRPLALFAQLTSLLTEFLTLSGVVIMLCSFSWWSVLIMLLAGIPSFGIYLYRVRILYEWRKNRVKDNRKANYHGSLLTGRNFAKEIRSFGMVEFVQKRFWDIRMRLFRQHRKISRITSLTTSLTALTDVAAALLILYLLLHQTVLGLLTVGGFVMYFQAFRKGGTALRSLVASLSGVYENHLFLANLFEFLELEHHIQSPQNPIPFPEKIEKGIRFENVRFRYPGCEKYVLDEVNQTFVPHQLNCIRGANGMGKTTMMKLLSRMYDCEEGAIYIDDIDIRRFDLNELRRNISFIFQDFMGYAFTFKENVTLGEEAEDPVRWQEAMAASGADKVAASLPHAEQTQLGRIFDGGQELSMGQWQRLALARALYKKSPILVLDEPNSWMDAEGRRNFSEHLPALCKERLVILISHEEQVLEIMTKDIK